MPRCVRKNSSAMQCRELCWAGHHRQSVRVLPHKWLLANRSMYDVLILCLCAQGPERQLSISVLQPGSRRLPIREHRKFPGIRVSWEPFEGFKTSLHCSNAARGNQYVHGGGPCSRCLRVAWASTFFSSISVLQCLLHSPWLIVSVLACWRADSLRPWRLETSGWRSGFRS